MFEFLCMFMSSFCDGILHPKCGGWVGACAMKAQDCELFTHPPTSKISQSLKGRWMSNADKFKNGKRNHLGRATQNPQSGKNCSIDTPFLRRKNMWWADHQTVVHVSFVNCFAVWCFSFLQLMFWSERFGGDVSKAVQIWISCFLLYIYTSCEYTIECVVYGCTVCRAPYTNSASLWNVFCNLSVWKILLAISSALAC